MLINHLLFLEFHMISDHIGRTQCDSRTNIATAIILITVTITYCTRHRPEQSRKCHTFESSGEACAAHTTNHHRRWP